MIQRILREPLLHFLLIGIGLFALYDALGGGDTGAPRDIVVTGARVQALTEGFATARMRPPTAEEIKGLVDDYIAEEMYYREAIAIGLDEDDTVIRQRLRQKMEFISEDAAATEPTDTQLQSYLGAHPERFTEPSELTFVQVYISTEKRGDRAGPSAEQLLAELRAGHGPALLADAGDPTSLPGDMQSASPEVIANVFGSDFASRIEEAPVGQWTGPLQSAFGLHLVRVDDRTAVEMAAFEQIRPIVLREWQSEQRTQSNKAYLDSLRARYEIRVEPEATALFAQPADGGGTPIK